MPSIPFKGDIITTIIEVVGRPGRWLLEAAFCCIIGVILFSHLGVILTLLSAFTSLDFDKGELWLPSVGWWVGLGVGVLRLWPCLRKPIARPVNDSGNVPVANAGGSIVYSPVAAAQFSMKERGLLAAKSAGVTGLIGLVAGLFLSLYLCIVITAVTHSPISPETWSAPMRVSEFDHDPSRRDRNGFDEPTNVKTDASFWHPVFSPILSCSLVGGLSIGFLAGAYLGWNSVPAADQHETDHPR